MHWQAISVRIWQLVLSVARMVSSPAVLGAEKYSVHPLDLATPTPTPSSYHEIVGLDPKVALIHAPKRSQRCCGLVPGNRFHGDAQRLNRILKSGRPPAGTAASLRCRASDQTQQLFLRSAVLGSSTRSEPSTVVSVLSADSTDTDWLQPGVSARHSYSTMVY